MVSSIGKEIHILASIFPDTKSKVKMIIINFFPWIKITFIQQHAPNSSATAIRNNKKCTYGPFSAPQNPHSMTENIPLPFQKKIML